MRNLYIVSKTIKTSVIALVITLVACTSTTIPAITPTSTPTNTPIPTNTLIPTDHPESTNTPPPAITFTPIPTWTAKGPGVVVCPILLYHRIDPNRPANEYNIKPDDFQSQMSMLKNLGYETITIDTLLQAIDAGALLPERPIIISFDDGDETVYSQAFPIMKALGFVGAIYLVGNYVGTEGYMTITEIQNLEESGWSIGSHSMTHRDLTQIDNPEWEISQSRANLEESIGVPINTFAYPFGATNKRLIKLTKRYYKAAMGLGVLFKQGNQNRYYLWRRPVDGRWDLQTFAQYLPWDK